MSALKEQVGGTHYKDMAIQPVEFILANNVGYMEGHVIKYVCRWRQKGGVQDLEKARHFLAMLIELEKGREDRERDHTLHSGARFDATGAKTTAD